MPFLFILASRFFVCVSLNVVWPHRVTPLRPLQILRLLSLSIIPLPCRTQRDRHTPSFLAQWRNWSGWNNGMQKVSLHRRKCSTITPPHTTLVVTQKLIQMCSVKLSLSSPHLNPLGIGISSTPGNCYTPSSTHCPIPSRHVPPLDRYLLETISLPFFLSFLMKRNLVTEPSAELNSQLPHHHL